VLRFRATARRAHSGAICGAAERDAKGARESKTVVVSALARELEQRALEGYVYAVVERELDVQLFRLGSAAWFAGRS
jgi:hypothetical protein